MTPSVKDRAGFDSKFDLTGILYKGEQNKLTRIALDLLGQTRYNRRSHARKRSVGEAGLVERRR